MPCYGQVAVVGAVVIPAPFVTCSDAVRLPVMRFETAMKPPGHAGREGELPVISGWPLLKCQVYLAI